MTNIAQTEDSTAITGRVHVCEMPDCPPDVIMRECQEGRCYRDPANDLASDPVSYTSTIQANEKMVSDTYSGSRPVDFAPFATAFLFIWLVIYLASRL